MENKFKGIIYYSKKIKDNDLFIKILSSNDEINSGIVYGGNSSKNKLIYQNGYFVDFIINKKNENSPPRITAEIIKPLLSNIIQDKYKLNALLSLLSLINISIVEGQNIKGFYKSIYNLIVNIINQKHWIFFYCEWLFYLLQLIGYQVDYQNDIKNKFYDIAQQKFIFKPNINTIEFPHNLFSNNKDLSFRNINSIFVIFENIFLKNHLDNINYKMPVNFTNFKRIILERLQS